MPVADSLKSRVDIDTGQHEAERGPSAIHGEWPGRPTVDPHDCADLRVVIMGLHHARDRNALKLYFRWLLHKPSFENHVVFAEFMTPPTGDSRAAAEAQGLELEWYRRVFRARHSAAHGCNHFVSRRGECLRYEVLLVPEVAIEPAVSQVRGCQDVGKARRLDPYERLTDEKLAGGAGELAPSRSRGQKAPRP